MKTLILFTFVSNDFEIMTQNGQRKRHPETNDHQQGHGQILCEEREKSKLSPKALVRVSGNVVLLKELGRGASLGEDDLSFGSFESEVTSEKLSRVVQSAAWVKGEVKAEDTDLLFFLFISKNFHITTPTTCFVLCFC